MNQSLKNSKLVQVCATFVWVQKLKLAQSDVWLNISFSIKLHIALLDMYLIWIVQINELVKQICKPSDASKDILQIAYLIKSCVSKAWQSRIIFKINVLDHTEFHIKEYLYKCNPPLADFNCI